MLNAFRHHRGRHGLGRSRGVDADVECSTPFGITEVGTTRSLMRGRCRVGCSTPFGITEVGTIARTTLEPVAGPCAQRLSASQRSARRAVIRRYGLDAIMCSTPFGITEVGTSLHVGMPSRRIRVLNAFRHHRGRHRGCPTRARRGRRGCSTPFGITEVGTLSELAAKLERDRCSTPFGITEVGTEHVPGSTAVRCSAQRLSASQRSARATARSIATPLISAQRLSASQRSARSAASVRQSAIAVLNAFRHHRGRHASARRRVESDASTCSTPFGITEVGTVEPQHRDHRARRCAQRLSASQRSALKRSMLRPCWRARVLNAFRHHRGRHVADARSRSALTVCSTPFGITEVGTGGTRDAAMHRVQCSTPFGITEVGTRMVAHARCRLDRGAQRLSASQRSALDVDDRPGRRSTVLNAFRHHRGRHRSPTVASRDWRSMCSTPFGITEVGTLASAIDPSRRDVCSTPFGITEVGTSRASLTGRRP